MDHTFTKELKEKTRIVVTHAVHFLRYADRVIYMEDGEITFMGTYNELKKNEIFSNIISKEEEKVEETKIAQKPVEKKEEPTGPIDEVRKLDGGPVKPNPLLRMFASEDRSTGSISLSVIHAFIKLCGGYFVMGFILLMTAAACTAQIYAVRYLFAWAAEFTEEGKWTKMGIYTSILYGYCTISSFRMAIILWIGVILSRRIHARMVYRVIHAPVEEFLEIVPIGRILNRFTKDINVIDKILMKNFAIMMHMGLLVAAQIAFMILSLGPLVSIPLALYIIVAFYYQIQSSKTRREMVRLEAVSKTPIITWAAQTIKGLPEIRTSGLSPYFRERMQNLIEKNLQNSIMAYGLDCWFKLRVSLANIFIVQIPTFAYALYVYRDKLPVVDTAMFLLLSTILIEDITKFLTLVGEIESNLISIERCQYFNKIPFESGYKNAPKEEKKNLFPSSKKDPRTLCLPFASKIVKNGEVKFESVTARYGEDAEPVLRGLNFTVRPGEKIGIVGRTGAGKSSLIKLFWLSLRPSSGRILVDGTDLANVDIKDFRSEVMVVSQESAMFQGNLRDNIDPTTTSADDPSILSTLERLRFKSKHIAAKGLDAKVEANGDNFSQGEKQVICFSRTLVNKRKLIILDEATASIDLQTERAIQEVQEKEFPDSTMFIIAHRINTVLKCDRIMVLKFGEIMEFDSPQKLLNTPGSYFKDIYDKMVEQNEGM